jgi:hypothetical protein
LRERRALTPPIRATPWSGCIIGFFWSKMTATNSIWGKKCLGCRSLIRRKWFYPLGRTGRQAPMACVAGPLC